MLSKLLAQSDVNSLVENGSFFQDSNTGDYKFTLSGIDYQIYDFYDYHYHYYHPLLQVPNTPNKTEIAFKVVKVLLDNKLVKIERIKTFIHLMDEIVKVL